MCSATNERLQDGSRKNDKVCLLLNSTGGSLDDGLALYGFLRSLPMELITVNVGIIASIAIAPYMAGKKRIALPHSRFHFHDYEWNYGAPHNLTRIEYLDHTQFLNSARDATFEILKEHTSLTDEDLKHLKLLDIPTIKDAAFAKQKGIVHEVDYFAITEEINIFNVDY